MAAIGLHIIAARLTIQNYEINEQLHLKGVIIAYIKHEKDLGSICPSLELVLHIKWSIFPYFYQ